MSAIPERAKVIKAIKELGRRVTVSDVAAKTGLPLITTTRALNSVASDCRGTIQVTKEGNLVYAFSPAFDAAYFKTGLALFFMEAGQQLFKLAYFLLRISFGVTLIASVVTVAILIVVALIAIMSKSDSGGDSGGGFDFDFGGLDDIGQFFVWDTALRVASPGYGYGYGYGYGGYDSNYGTISSSERDYAAYTQGKYIPQGDTSKPKSQGFVLNCFSYLFGDGDPNKGIDEQKWQMIAEHIRVNNGVSTAEQLGCFTGAGFRKEDAALPVLVRFDGQPTVTDTGNIIYVFPSLQNTAQQQQQFAPSQPVPNYLEEKPWTFSVYDAGDFIPVAIFAFMNFVGCVWLFRHMTTIAVLHPFRVLIDYLTIYASFFLFFPMLRYIGLQVLNIGIKKRNKQRAANYQLTRQRKHQQKLAEARVLAITADPTKSDQIVYSSDKDILEQEFDR
jgi:hypothetical protein